MVARCCTLLFLGGFAVVSYRPSFLSRWSSTDWDAKQQSVANQKQQPVGVYVYVHAHQSSFCQINERKRRLISSSLCDKLDLDQRLYHSPNISVRISRKPNELATAQN